MVDSEQSSDGRSLPERFPVSVLIERCPSSSAWAEEVWRAVGVSAGAAERSEVRKVFDQAGVARFLCPGFALSLYPDECESYYYNLLSEQPCCYVVADLNDEGRPTPVLVSLSFDEAHAYLEGEREVYAVALPPELYRWVETYVLTHYVPQRRTKRKREDWKTAGREQRR